VVTALARTLTWLVLAAMAAPAAAHGILLASTPTAGEALPLGMRALDLHFNVRIEPRLSKLRLAGPSGEDVPLREEPTNSAYPARLTATPPPLAPGIYTVRWQIFTADGHLSHGRFSFQVGERK
jgi:methionine-rich copper-binding protein CopC